MIKQKKFMKNVLVTICVMSLLVSTNAIAASSRLSKTFTKKKVDSNEYRKVAEITKKQEYEYGYVTIDEIYKADGSSSRYKKIKAKVYCKPDKKWILCGSGKVIKKKKESRLWISVWSKILRM